MPANKEHRDPLRAELSLLDAFLLICIFGTKEISFVDDFIHDV